MPTLTATDAPIRIDSLRGTGSRGGIPSPGPCPLLSIGIAEAPSVSFVNHLQNRSYARDAGWIPRGALEERIKLGHVLVATLNGQPAAHLVLAPRADRILHVSQVVVDEEAWRAGIGSALMAEAYRIGALRACTTLTVKCALDAPAHRFWPESAMQWIATTTSRRRLVACWSRPIGEDGSIRMPPPMRRPGCSFADAVRDTPIPKEFFP